MFEIVGRSGLRQRYAATAASPDGLFDPVAQHEFKTGAAEPTAIMLRVAPLGGGSVRRQVPAFEVAAAGAARARTWGRAKALSARGA